MAGLLYRVLAAEKTSAAEPAGLQTETVPKAAKQTAVQTNAAAKKSEKAAEQYATGLTKAL